MLRPLLPTAQRGYSHMIYGQNEGFEEFFCEQQVELTTSKEILHVAVQPPSAKAAPLVGQNQAEEWSPMSGLQYPSGKYKAAKKEQC